MISLDELTVQDLKDIEVLQGFRNKAEYLYSTLISHVRVPLYIGESPKFKIKSRSDSNNAEYLTLKSNVWIWQARYLHQTYDVPITKEGIYRMMVNSYEFEKEHKGSCLANRCKEALGYFEGFAKNVATNDEMVEC